MSKSRNQMSVRMWPNDKALISKARKALVESSSQEHRVLLEKSSDSYVIGAVLAAFVEKAEVSLHAKRLVGRDAGGAGE